MGKKEDTDVDGDGGEHEERRNDEPLTGIGGRVFLLFLVFLVESVLVIRVGVGRHHLHLSLTDIL